MNKVRLTITALLLGALFCQKATCAPALVQFPSGPAGWTVDITPSPSHGSAPLGGNHFTKLEVSQDDQKRRTVITMSNGVTGERWSIPATNMILVEAPDGSVYGVPNAGENVQTFGLPYFDSDFTWVKPGTLVEKDPVSYQGKLCFHYKGTVKKPLLGTAEPATTTIQVEAWIDSKTGLPVSLDDGTWQAAYTFRAPPFPPLNVSPNFQKAYARLSR